MAAKETWSRIADVLCTGMLAVSVASVVSMGIVTLVEIVARAAFSTSLLVTEDFVKHLLSLSIFTGLAPAFRAGQMIRVSLLLDRFSPRGGRLAETALLGLTLAGVLVLTWFVARATIKLFERGTMSTGIVPFPLWIPEASILISLGVLLVVLVCMIAETLALPSGRDNGGAP
ncbi:TRAP transporter small permease [Sulfitobacter sp. MOLA879]|uniref:TRAP transporter small permease n=1 Tax=Sulfitobacter sp. MOLA879 TaxID=3368579 RepID=UPI0037475AA6